MDLSSGSSLVAMVKSAGLGQSRLRSCLASLGTIFGRAQKSLFFWAGDWFFTSSADTIIKTIMRSLRT